MNTPAANRRMIDLIHADKGTTRNTGQGGGATRSRAKEREAKPKPRPSGRRAQPRSDKGYLGGHGFEGGRLLA